jgi:23S rRNA (guanosine2251-2'-O)-methyltransferase
MVKTHHYSQAKFTSFNPEQQLKAIVEMLSALEDNLADHEFVKTIIPPILDCYKWSDAELQKDLHILENLTPGSDPHSILHLINPLLRRLQRNYNENDPQVYRFDGREKSSLGQVPYPITVIADNIRSSYNLGAIYRTAECVSARWMYLCGISSFPPLNAFLKSSMGTEERVPYTLMHQTVDAIAQARKTYLPVIALETASPAKCLFDYRPTQPVAVILGNEALGIEENVLKLADEVLYIPVYGWKNSLNVSNAFTLAAYWLSGVIK